jgi:hypothetical protein
VKSLLADFLKCFYLGLTISGKKNRLKGSGFKVKGVGYRV